MQWCCGLNVCANVFAPPQADNMGVMEEKARQSCSCFTKTGREMAPVKPSRCSAVWGDLQSFHKRIAKSEAEIAALKKAADGGPATPCYLTPWPFS